MSGRDRFLAAVQAWVEREEVSDPWTDPLETDSVLKKALRSYPPPAPAPPANPDGPTPQQQWKWLQDFLAKTSKKVEGGGS